LIDGVHAGADWMRTAPSGGQPLEFARIQLLRPLDESDNVPAVRPKDLMRRLELADDGQFAKAAVALSQQVIPPVAPLATGSFMRLALPAVAVVRDVSARTADCSPARRRRAGPRLPIPPLLPRAIPQVPGQMNP
jgi:hypothetical protein